MRLATTNNQQTNSTNAITLFLKDVNADSILTAKEELELAKKKDAGDLKAKKKLITSNLRLVISVARNFQNRGCDLEDLIQEGNIGLIEGIEKYDHTKGFRLSTYACWWIRQKIDRYVANNGKNVRIPVHVLTLSNRLKKFMEDYRKQFDNNPSISEISSMLDCTEDMAEEALQVVLSSSNSEVPLDITTSSNSNFTKLFDESPSPLDILEEEDTTKILKNILSELSERDEKLVRLRFGIQENIENDKEFPISVEEYENLLKRLIK